MTGTSTLLADPAGPPAPGPAAPKPGRWHKIGPLAVKLGELAVTNAATFAFPLVFAVVCGRNLGLQQYGVVSFYAALSGFLGMFVEFGFDWYGTREVAPAEAAAGHRQRVLRHIVAAKLLLWLGACVVMAPALLWWRGAHEWPYMVASAAYLLGFACDASWYLRARERTRLLMVTTAIVRLLGVLLLVLAVAEAASITLALWAYALVSLAGSACHWLLLRRLGVLTPGRIEWDYLRSLLHRASAIVLGNLNGALLTNGGIALLALLADDATAGAANLALRLRLASQALMLPLLQLGFVRISAAAHRDTRAGLSLGRKLLAATLVLAVPIALAGMFAAPAITQYVFKGDVPLAVSLCMLMALCVPVQAVGNLFGVQSLVAFGRERRYAQIQLFASLVFMAVLFAFSPQQSYGWAVLAAESVVMVLSALALVRLQREARA